MREYFDTFDSFKQPVRFTMDKGGRKSAFLNGSLTGSFLTLILYAGALFYMSREYGRMQNFEYDQFKSEK